MTHSSFLPATSPSTWRRLLAAESAVALAVLGLTSTAAVADEAESVEIFSTALPAGAIHSPSWAFRSQRTAELGMFVEFADDERDLETITIGLNSWACETGRYQDSNCVTTPGTSYTHPITVTVYEVDESGERPAHGDTVATLTQAVDVPFRPTNTPDQCSDTRMWYSESAGTCQNGFAFWSTFDFGAQGVELPDRAIISIAYETGYMAGVDAGNWDTLNVALLVDEGPSTGTRIYDDAWLINTTVTGNYDDAGAGGVGVLRHSTGYQRYAPVIQVNAAVEEDDTPVTPDPGTPDPGTPAPGQPLPGLPPTDAEPGERVEYTFTSGDQTLTIDAILGDHPSGELILAQAFIADPSSIDTLPAGVSFPFGAQSFELNVAVGTTATLTIETPRPANVLYKHLGDGWEQYPATFSGTSTTFSLTDGGDGDADGVADGVIVDPVAPAIAATFTG